MNLFMHEAHVHTLPNMNNTNILVIQQEGRYVRMMLYSLGWEPQQAVTRPAVKAVMRSTSPPVLLNLNRQNTHFSAYVYHSNCGKRLTAPTLGW